GRVGTDRSAIDRGQNRSGQVRAGDGQSFAGSGGYQQTHRVGPAARIGNPPDVIQADARGCGSLVAPCADAGRHSAEPGGERGGTETAGRHPWAAATGGREKGGCGKTAAGSPAAR